MKQQDLDNLEFAVTQWGTSGRQYRITFGCSGVIIQVYKEERLRWVLFQEVWGKFQYHQ